MRHRLLTLGPGNEPLWLRLYIRQIDEVWAAMIVEALKRAGGNVSQAVRQMGISRPALYDFMQKHHIERESFSQADARRAV